MFFDSGKKKECFGCEACAQVCVKNAITMKEDIEGFRYPCIDESICVGCGLCKKTCPYENLPKKYIEEKYAYGGYNVDENIRYNSTSGGAFTAIVDSFCDDNYVIFGAASKGLQVFHGYITNKNNLKVFRKSKYEQSTMGLAYKKVRFFLNEGRKVLFSGTPCQIAGLLVYLDVFKTNIDKLLTVEVICEGVPSPLYIRKLDKYINNKYGGYIQKIDYRYTGKSILSNGKWDFEQMRLKIRGADYKKCGCLQKNRVSDNETINLAKDRWNNPFWSIWLQHLMSRPSCYNCQFTTVGRIADISLGDLWGVHLYCPELYGKNGGASLVVCNTEKGKNVFRKAQEKMIGHELSFEEALKYQSPMRKTIDMNKDRDVFMSDLESDMDYRHITKKWAKGLKPRLFCQKYIWGNRQKVLFWNIKKKLIRKRG